ncbi:hypothetical protein C8Q77DRAFT_715329 [Trametes polyzona]|nr:hypothetical protein C8Q77DRAFT_715329 [Trametes polyzona]
MSSGVVTMAGRSSRYSKEQRSPESCTSRTQSADTVGFFDSALTSLSPPPCVNSPPSAALTACERSRIQIDGLCFLLFIDEDDGGRKAVTRSVRKPTSRQVCDRPEQTEMPKRNPISIRGSEGVYIPRDVHVLTPSQVLDAASILDQSAPNSTFGAFLVGNFVALMLYGANLYQCTRYVRTYPGDPLWLKSLVFVTVLFETFSSALGIHSCYFFLVTKRSLPLAEAFSIGLWSLNMYPLMVGSIIVISQSFFVRRLWLLGGRSSRVMVIIVAGLSFGVIALFAMATARMFIDNSLLISMPVLASLVSKAFLLAMIADLLLMVMLIRVLRENRTGVKATNSMIDTVIVYTVRTGALTGIFDLFTTIYAFVLPSQNIYMSFGLPGTRMYAITLLAALNSRQWTAARDANQHGCGSGSGTLEDAAHLVFGGFEHPYPRSRSRYAASGSTSRVERCLRGPLGGAVGPGGCDQYDVDPEADFPGRSRAVLLTRMGS